MPPIGAPGVMAQSRASGLGLGKRDLLYVTNSNWTVAIYRYWQRTYEGDVTDLRGPGGACAAFSGEVFITDPGHGKIYAFAHGGSSPISVLHDSGFVPGACAVAPSSGDVAVANRNHYGSGDVAVYRHGSGKPVLFHGDGRHGDQFDGCAYDDRGDLLAVSSYHISAWHNDYYYLPRGGKQLALITLPHAGKDWQVQSIQWDGQYWVVGPIDRTLYLYSIDHKAHYIGAIGLQGYRTYGATAFGPVWIYRRSISSRGTEVVGVTNFYSTYGGYSSVEYWDYPAGGSPIGEITAALIGDPLAVTISLGKR
jgi:hypothetical protein